jgi:hypothetical protein
VIEQPTHIVATNGRPESMTVNPLEDAARKFVFRARVADAIEHGPVSDQTIATVFPLHNTY